MEPWGYLLTAGFTAASGQTINACASGGWLTGVEGEYDSAAPSAEITEHAPFFIWIECEVGANVPVIGYYGDSLFSGVSARLPVYDSAPVKHARALSAFPALFTASGTSIGATDSGTDFFWNRYATTEGSLELDGMVWGMGSNDIFGGATIADMRARFELVWDIAVKLTPNIGLCTILPRHNSADPDETVRQKWNEILTVEYAGRASSITDPASALSNPDGETLDQRFSATPSDIHLTAAGYARYAANLPVVAG